MNTKGHSSLYETGTEKQKDREKWSHLYDFYGK